MKISYNWLKWYIPEIPAPKELERTLTFHVTEIEDVEEVAGDTIFDLKILPDRAGDLLSHQGVARELSGLLGLEFVDPTPKYKVPEAAPTKLEVDIQTPKCRRYMGRIVRNVTVGPSPEWVVTHLASIGQRSINNIVDATNLVMFDCGHPVHAFDLKKLASEKIIVREAHEELDFPVVGSEQIVAKIKAGDVMIADTDKAIALAGIKGGTNSGISIDAPYTTDIVLEVANFDPTSVRRTGQRLSLLSDARKRFENNLPLQLGDYAMRELSALIAEMCPQAVFEDIVHIGAKGEDTRQISFTTDIISEKLGLILTPADIARILSNYKYGYAEENGSFIVHVPYWRQDINGIHDMVEEIGRVYGYEKIIPSLPTFPENQTHDEIYLKIEAVKKHLIKEGYSEVVNYTFGKKGDIQVARGPKGKDFLRTNLTDGMKESFEKNRLNAPLLGLTEVKLFEVGTVFTKDVESIHVALATKQGIEEITLDEFVLKNNIAVIPDLIRYPENSHLDSGPESGMTQFKLWSDYPFVFRDVSFWSDKELTETDFAALLAPVLSPLCVKGPYLIDSFSKDGRYSYAFRFVFQSYEKTLTEDDASGEWSKILEVVQKEGFEIR